MDTKDSEISKIGTKDSGISEVALKIIPNLFKEEEEGIRRKEEEEGIRRKEEEKRKRRKEEKRKRRKEEEERKRRKEEEERIRREEEEERKRREEKERRLLEGNTPSTKNFIEKFQTKDYKIKPSVHETLERFTWIVGDYGVERPTDEMPYRHLFLEVDQKMNDKSLKQEIDEIFQWNASKYIELRYTEPSDEHSVQHV